MMNFDVTQLLILVKGMHFNSDPLGITETIHIKKIKTTFWKKYCIRKWLLS
jgi:hypothetical protein